ncbi:hypothetical protein D9613_006833 [Agrocybe pediades]|uniref:Splicing factor U2AF subunit n=1 Tax=Agrocybe pediades TaxID=84607 RepID=A0A8H4QGL7_9AGAR|nr:hypothetical protein D9613_006833 [Agrocybe pediades]
MTFSSFAVHSYGCMTMYILLTLQPHDPRFAHPSSFFFPIFSQDTAKIDTALPEMTVAIAAGTVTAEEGTVIDMVAIETEEGEEGIETAVTGTAVVGVAATMTTTVGVLDMTMIGAVTIVVEMMMALPVEDSEMMVLLVIAEVEEKDEMEWALPSGGLQRLRELYLCLRGGAKHQVGTSMHRVTNSIPLCKQNKQIPPILGIAGLPPPMPVQTFGMGIGANPNLSRQSRRLYIGSITPEVNEQNLADFFNSKMIEMNIGTGGPGNPVLAVQCNYEKNYAFVEFRSAEDATAAMAFDGIIFINGPLKIRRPKDYGGMEMSSPGVHVPGVVSTNVPDSINKVFVGGLPTYLNEENVMELLKSFGELKAFNLVRENGTGASKGFAFFEYVDAGVTDVAIQSLNGMELGDRYLVVQRASVGAKPGTPGLLPNPNLPYDQFEIPRPIMPAGKDPTTDARILLMLNMVTNEDLVDDADYGDLYEDVKEECANYGKLEDLRIPRPVKKDKSKWGETGISAQDAARLDEAAGVGRVYVKYADPESASKALNALAGRSFAGRSIIATLLSEDSQTTPPLNIIFAPQPEAPPPLPTS